MVGYSLFGHPDVGRRLSRGLSSDTIMVLGGCWLPVTSSPPQSMWHTITTLRVKRSPSYPRAAYIITIIIIMIMITKRKDLPIRRGKSETCLQRIFLEPEKKKIIKTVHFLLQSISHVVQFDVGMNEASWGCTSSLALSQVYYAFSFKPHFASCLQIQS